MPNTVVKLINAESTRPEAAREDRKLLIKRKRIFRDGYPFSFVNLQEIFLLFFYVWEVGANCSADVLSHSAAAPQLKSVRIRDLRIIPFMEYESMVAYFPPCPPYLSNQVQHYIVIDFVRSPVI